MRRLFLFHSAVLFVLVSHVSAQSVLYVNAGAPSGGNGTSWPLAYNSLQSALANAAGSGGTVNQIWVAAGTYKPDGGTLNRSASFLMADNLALYGGFAGSETQLTQRNPTANPTVLSGDLLGDDASSYNNYSDNSYHVVKALSLSASATIDGFTIRSGYANQGVGSDENFGGGLFNKLGTPVIRQCTFSLNWGGNGGGIGNLKGNPSVTSCTFDKNYSNNYGGGMANFGAPGFPDGSVRVRQCVFTQNYGINGGGLSIKDGDGSVVQCSFDANGGTGAGMYLYSGTFAVKTCNVTNSIGQGGYLYFSDSTVTDSTFASSLGTGLYTTGTSAMISGCTFDQNSSGQGGGLFSSSGVTGISKCLFRLNHATADGGGANVAYATTARIHDCRFVGNSADQGGGISCSDAEIADCVFTGNTASYQGGGIGNIYLGPTGAKIVNCTLAFNSAASRGGGIETSAQNAMIAYVTNCILWQNDVGGVQDENAQLASFFGPTHVSLNYSDVQGLTGGYGGAGNLSGDPKFVSPLGPDGLPGTDDDVFRLLGNSPCIDAGDNTAVPADALDLDLDMNTSEPIPLDATGAARFVDDPNTPDSGNGSAPIVDIGAIEDQGCSAYAYCIGAPNSTGNGGSIGYSGSVSITANNLTLVTTGLPPSSHGFYFYGPAQAQVAYGNGFRCVAGGGGIGLFRLPVTSAVAGILSYPTDNTVHPMGSGAGHVLAGSSWNFQLWYRDPAGGGALFNFSNALGVHFCP